MADRVPHPCEVAESTGRLVHGIEPFALFCAYHLGITAENRAVFQNIHHVARRFATSVEVIQEALIAYGLDSDTLIHSPFPLASAQADVQVSPPGVDLVGLARMHYEALLQTPPGGRDWEAEMREAAEENRRIFDEDKG